MRVGHQHGSVFRIYAWYVQAFFQIVVHLVQQKIRNLLLRLAEYKRFPAGCFYEIMECSLFIRLFFLFRQVVHIFRHFLVVLVLEKHAALPPCVAKINQFADKGAFPYLSATDGRKVQGLLGYLEFAFVLTAQIFDVQIPVIFFLQQITTVFPYLHLAPKLMFGMGIADESQPFR